MSFFFKTKKVNSQEQVVLHGFSTQHFQRPEMAHGEADCADSEKQRGPSDPTTLAPFRDDPTDIPCI